MPLSTITEKAPMNIKRISFCSSLQEKTIQIASNREILRNANDYAMGEIPHDWSYRTTFQIAKFIPHVN